MIPIPVNATFNTLGDVKIKYVQLEDDEHMLHDYKIQSIEWSKEERRAGIHTITFACYIQEKDGILKRIKIAFYVDTHKWVLYK